NVRPSASCKHRVRAGPPPVALATTEASGLILLAHFPAPPLGDLAQGGDLVIDGLLVGGYADVNCGALLHDGPPMLSGPYHINVLKTAVCWKSTRAGKHH